jgi:PRTRC genetic system protein A
MLETFPVAIAPHEGALSDPTKAGMRYVLASDGVYREISTCWMVRRKLHGPCRLPYGDLQESLTFLMEAPPLELWKEFLAQARQALPNECAGLMIWNQTSQQWRLEMRIAHLASKVRIDYIEARLDDDEVGVVDIHSHGVLRAGFSQRDNRDDMGGIKVAAVVGRVDQPSPEFVMRLVAIDEFMPLTMVGGQFKEQRSEALPT